MQLNVVFTHKYKRIFVDKPIKNFIPKLYLCSQASTERTEKSSTEHERTDNEEL